MATRTTAAKAARSSKTPAERAQEAFDTAVRVTKRIEDRIAKAKAEVAELEGELAAAVKRRDYLGQNPDLPTQPGEPDGGDEVVNVDGGTPEG